MTVLNHRGLAGAAALLLAVACSNKGSGGGLGGQDDGASSLPSCADTCVDVVAAQCSNGPPTQQDCVTGCEQIRAGPCAAQYNALFQCSGATPDYACDAQGFVTVAGCETEYQALSNCLATR